MDVSRSTEASNAYGQSNLTNKRLLRRRLTALSQQIREMKEVTGRKATLFFKTEDNKFLRVSSDPDNPICEVEASNQELLDWMKQAREVKKLEKQVEAVGKKKREQFEELKSDLEKHFLQIEEAASDSVTTSNSEYCTRQSRDGSATASVSSSACCSGLGRRRK